MPPALTFYFRYCGLFLEFEPRNSILYSFDVQDLIRGRKGDVETWGWPLKPDHWGLTNPLSTAMGFCKKIGGGCRGEKTKKVPGTEGKHFIEVHADLYRLGWRGGHKSNYCKSKGFDWHLNYNLHEGGVCISNNLHDPTEKIGHTPIRPQVEPISYDLSAQDANYATFEFIMRATGERFIAKTSIGEIARLARDQLGMPLENRTLHINGDITKNVDGQNYDWEWAFVPDQWELAAFSIKECDKTLEFINQNYDDWSAKGKSFCPWQAKLNREL